MNAEVTYRCDNCTIINDIDLSVITSFIKELLLIISNLGFLPLIYQLYRKGKQLKPKILSLDNIILLCIFQRILLVCLASLIIMIQLVPNISLTYSSGKILQRDIYFEFCTFDTNKYIICLPAASYCLYALMMDYLIVVLAEIIAASRHLKRTRKSYCTLSIINLLFSVLTIPVILILYFINTNIGETVWLVTLLITSLTSLLVIIITLYHTNFNQKIYHFGKNLILSKLFTIAGSFMDQMSIGILIGGSINYGFQTTISCLPYTSKLGFILTAILYIIIRNFELWCMYSIVYERITHIRNHVVPVSNSESRNYSSKK